jgi:hypothetical protein
MSLGAGGVSPGTAVVTAPGDAGAGTLRDALLAASADPAIRTIKFAPGIGTVSLTTPLLFNGTQALEIDGEGATIEGPDCAGCAALVVNGAGGLTLQRLTVNGAGGNGVTLNVPADAVGVVEVRLVDAAVRDNGLHGLLVEDQVEESAASIRLVVFRSTIEGNGFVGPTDLDGIRVNEGGIGDIDAQVQNSSFLANGADGLELDERGEGSVVLDARQSHFDDNGPLDPDDLDDGIDVDEAGYGDIEVNLVGVTLDRNFDEGLDLNEGDAGSLLLFASDVHAHDNSGGDNVQLEELGDGSMHARINGLSSSGAEDDGIQAEEADAGNLFLTLVNATITGNSDDGVVAEQGGAGGGLVELVAGTIAGNGDDDVNADGVEVK